MDEADSTLGGISSDIEGEVAERMEMQSEGGQGEGETTISAGKAKVGNVYLAPRSVKPPNLTCALITILIISAMSS